MGLQAGSAQLPILLEPGGCRSVDTLPVSSRLRTKRKRLVLVVAPADSTHDSHPLLPDAGLVTREMMVNRTAQ